MYIIGVPERALGWLPLALVVEDEPSKLSYTYLYLVALTFLLIEYPIKRNDPGGNHVESYT